jgi:hypothetical protein
VPSSASATTGRAAPSTNGARLPRSERCSRSPPTLDKEIEDREDFSSSMILDNLTVLNLCEVEIIDQALCEIVDRELVAANTLSPGAVWCDDVVEHHLRITALGGSELPRRFAVYCRSCETAVHDETLQLRDSVCQHLRESLGRQEPATLARLARWTRFVQGVSIRASHGGPAPIRTRLEVVLRWTGDIVVRAFMDVEDAMGPWSAPRTHLAGQNRFSDIAEGEPTARTVRDLVLQAWAHELDEHFHIGDELMLNPHDELLAVKPVPRIVPCAHIEEQVQEDGLGSEHHINVTARQG